MDTQMRVAFEDAVKCGGGEMWINIVNIVAFWVSNFSLDKRDAIQKSTAPCLYFEVHQMMEGEEGGEGEKPDGDWWGGAGVVTPLDMPSSQPPLTPMASHRLLPRLDCERSGS